MLFTASVLGEPELRVIQQVEELKTTLRSQLREPRRWVGSLRRLSLARAIQGSNSIEGYEAGIDDAVDVAAGEEPLDVADETGSALRGYRDAMTFVLQLAEEADFAYNAELVKGMHFMMTHYSLANRPGRWRAGSIFVRNEDTGEVVHEGADIEHVPALMAELTAQLNQGHEHPDMIRAAMAHLNTVMIHPFPDGNGRMARCLQSLVLARSGVLSPVFMSVEEYLGRNTQAYYDVLGSVGGGLWQPDRDTRPWIRFILTAHLRQARTMLRRTRESEQIWEELDRVIAANGLPERSGMALFDATIGLRVRNSTYRSYFADSPEAITEATASRDLAKLVQASLLEPRGERRGRHYVAGPPLLAIERRVRRERVRRDETDPFADAP